jgi:UDP-N-acetylmuramoyl-tripeptide--D-alanyl-D-alanine ligase
MKLTVEDILKIEHLEAEGFERHRGAICTGVSTDSRALNSGDLFVAIRGEKFDGHNFLSKAVEMGASCVVIERRWAETNPILRSSLHVPKLIVENTIHALGQLARIHRRKFRLPILVIGGSNGKTTTKDMIAAVLGTKYRVLATEGNLNNHIGVPMTLFRLEKRHQIGILEVGTNHFGEIEYLCSIIEPTHALITTIGREHLEFFQSLDGVAQAEGEAIQWIRNHRPNRGVVFVNADDPRIVRVAKGMRRTVRYGFGKGATSVRGKLLGTDADGCSKVGIKARGKRPFTVSLSVPGLHNAQNALAAAAVGVTFKVPAAKIQQALEQFKGSSKRMQVLKLDGITILNDTYNSNPDSVLAALQTLKSSATTGKKIAVLADMLELGTESEQEHIKIGKAIASYGVEYLLTYGPLSRLTHEAAQTTFKAHYDQKNVLAEYLAELLTPGDIVLIKGSRGMNMEDVVVFLVERFQQAA